MATATHKARLVMELRNAGITDTRVLSAIERVPREIFVPAAFRDRAYENSALPIGGGQTISQPLVVARMTQALEPEPRAKVLEVGTGSGYQAAVLATLTRRVYTIERAPDLLREAEARFAEMGLHNVTSKRGDGSLGWPEQAPFRRIIVTAAAAAIPLALTGQLAEDGIMVLPLGPARGRQVLVRLRRRGDEIVREDLEEVRFVPLVAGPARPGRSGIAEADAVRPDTVTPDYRIEGEGEQGAA